MKIPGLHPLNLRNILLACILLLGGLFVANHFAEVRKITLTLWTGDWRYVLLAILFEMLWLWGLGKTYQSIYRILGIQENHSHMLSLAAAANFLSVIAPTAGMSAMAIFLSDARKRGHPAARVTVAGAIYLLVEWLAILTAFALGIVVLIRRHTLHLPELVAAAFLLLASIGMVTLLILAARSKRTFGAVLAWLVRASNRIARPFIHRDCLPVEQANLFASEACACAVLIQRSTRTQLVRPFLFSLSNKVVLIGILTLVFLAFGVPFSAGTIVAGFSLAYLFVIVSPTPAGVGIVEGIMTLSLRSLGVPLEPAAVITLAFRGVTFWEPLFIGGYLLRRVNKSKETKLKQIN